MPDISSQTIVREHLATANIDAPLDRVELHRVVLGPGGRTGLHVHAGGTIGYILEGEVAFALDGDEPITLRAGDGFVEPAGRRMSHFDNLSTSRPVTFLCAYTLRGDQPLITAIDSPPVP